MPYMANLVQVQNFVQAKQLVGNGQCVSLVHAVVTSPPASMWHQGALVKGSNAPMRGTIIATFDSNGRYGNHTDGTSHAAIYLSQNVSGIVVIDQ